MNEKIFKYEKGTRGITLIALVVTIIVLLILAGITIASIAGENGILNRASDAREQTEQATEDEERQLAMAEAAMNLENTEYNDVTIPAGFAPTRIKGEDSVEDGLVIIDSEGNEFVWIPVENINNMSQCEAAGGACNLTLDSKGNLSCTNVEHIEQGKSSIIIGKLYANETGENFSKDANINFENDIGFREPDILTKYDGIYYENAGFNSLDSMKSVLKKEYKEMAESVAKNKGFFVGRYETSFTDATNIFQGESKIVQSKYGVIPASISNDAVDTWYEFYKLEKGFKTVKDNIKSSMIWGSQYDAMLNWLSDGENALKIKETNDENHNKSLSVAGSMISDKWKNIYDLEGNLREWTLECSLDDCRVTRGGNFNSAHSPSYRNNTFVPYNTGADNGSRITLFIK